MASINEAFNTILLTNEVPLRAYPIAGILQGKVVNTTYNIYVDDDGNYFIAADGKKSKLNIVKEDHGKEVEIPLIGWKYKIHLFDYPYKQQ